MLHPVEKVLYMEDIMNVRSLSRDAEEGSYIYTLRINITGSLVDYHRVKKTEKKRALMASQRPSHPQVMPLT
jgi:hypothetical protein